MALLIVAVRGVEVEAQVAAETGQPIAVKLAQAIDLAVQEIAAMELAEIASGIATSEAVLGIGAASETVPDSAAEMPAQVVAGGLPVWEVRVEVAVELVGEEVAAELVVAVAAVGGSLGRVQRKISFFPNNEFQQFKFFTYGRRHGRLYFIVAGSKNWEAKLLSSGMVIMPHLTRISTLPMDQP